MAEITAIEWTDSTVNFWWGCSNVSPGCDHCYAEKWNDFRGNKQWGPGAPRRKIKGAVAMLRSLQRGASAFFQLHGRPRRVFMHSMSDVFDHEVDAAWSAEMFAEAESADGLDIQFTTKRSGNVLKLIPTHWHAAGWPKHIGLIFSITSQKEAERDIERLLKLKRDLVIPWVGVSLEPLLSSVNVRMLKVGKNLWLDALTGYYSYKAGPGPNITIWKEAPGQPGPLPPLDWGIVGGESGPEARPMHPDWAISLQRQFAAGKVPFLFKQWGEWLPACDLAPEIDDKIYKSNRIARPDQCQGTIDELYGRTCKVPVITLQRDGTVKSDYPNGAMDMFKVGKKLSGRTLHGKTYTDFPRRAA